MTRAGVGVLAALVIGGGVLGGCGGSGAKPRAGGKPAATPSKAAAMPARPGDGPKPIADAVAISSLREQAIGLIEKESTALDPQVRANAVEAAGGSAGRLRPVIEKGLEDPNLGVRSVAAGTVAKRRMKGLTPRVRELLTDSSGYVRASAIGAMARCGEEVNETPLAEMLLTDPSPKLRSHAAFTLGEIGNHSADGMLKQAAGARLERASAGEVKIMQLQIAEAMVKLGDETQLQPIRAALYPSRPEELEAAVLAIQILGQVGDKAAKGQLMHMAGYKDQVGQPLPPEIRLAVASSLAKLGERSGGFIAEEFRAAKSPAVRAQAAGVYGEIGDGASLARLQEMMSDSEPLVRVAAAGGVLKAVGKE